MGHTVDPQAFFDELNRRHRVILELADVHGGVLDKFLGEGALVVFGLQAAGVPVSDAGAAAAVSFSREIVEALRRLRDEEAATWDIAIGLHTGPVVAGNLGSHTARLEFTVIGDAVNTAARLKELSHALHHPGIVSGDTAAHLGSSDGLVALEAAALRGRVSLVTCFALVP